ncbi:nucleolar protein 4-like isoform X1 [Anguilla anguilla]|nr:nucleolar protein 4-like isoform X1 [Anguilla anguilla]XP_035284581.1 nucleolar protein 4-like isoform X1 [Anguilla anguilla]
MEVDRDMYRQFQDWCLRTYGDSGKTKTVTRKKYERIVQLLNGSESNSSDNAKFKFWVKSKGFQLGVPDDNSEEKQVLYVPVKTTDGVGMDEKVSLRQVAVVEDFFDIIYSMHVERGTNGEKIRKHAGQKRTYKAISETYAFLPREAVTRFLMSCSECQKRMHLSQEGGEHKENGKPPTLVTSIIDYNMPITMAYMKHMKLQLLNSHNDEDSSVDSHEFDMSDSTRMSAMNSDLGSNGEDRMNSPQTRQLHKDDDSIVDTITGSESMTCIPAMEKADHCQEHPNNNCRPAMDQHKQPLSHHDCPLVATCYTDGHIANGSSKFKVISVDGQENKTTENGSKSPTHSHSSCDFEKYENGGELAPSLNQRVDDDDCEDHGNQDDCDKSMEAEGLQAEQLKIFNLQPVPSHPSSVAAENILVTACESESKKMRLQGPQDEEFSNEKHSTEEKAPADTTTQEVLYINGNGTYCCHNYSGLGGGPMNLTEAACSGPTDLSMKKQLTPSPGSSSNGSLQPQLNSTEMNTVRQLIAGYRESAAFLLRSADELESLILQQN